MNPKNRLDPAAAAVPIRAVTMNRLSPAAYSQLEKATILKLPSVPANDGQAQFAAGVEFVLRALRAGYVVEAE